MVTKTISINDELFMKITDIAQQNDNKFSAVVEKLCKLGIAYATLLELEKEKNIKQASPKA